MPESFALGPAPGSVADLLATSFFDETFEEVAASLPDLRGHELVSLLASATHVARNAVCITDADLDEPGPRIVYVNPAFERMTGWTVAEVVGRNPRFLQGPRTDRRVLRRLKADLEAGRPFQGETINYRRDGTPFVMAWRIAAVPDAEGRITHYVAAQDDLTQVRGTEHKLRSLAARLQSGLLPDLGEMGPVELAWRYHPAAEHALAGGDWYDAVELPNGSVAVFLGDTAGHGDEATALMGEFRFTCRGLVRSHDDPGRLLDELEAAVLTDHAPGEALASMVAAVVGADGTVRYSVAGHPPPVVRRASGDIEVLDRAQGRLLGAGGPSAPRPVATAELGPGDVLVAFSDGAFEQRSRDFDDTYRELLGRLAAAPATPLDQCEAAVAPVHEPGGLDDDVVALAVRCRHEADTPSA